MEVFNATAREWCTIKRERYQYTASGARNAKRQRSLFEAARILAEKTLLDPAFQSDNLARIQSISERLLARPFRVEEVQVVANESKRIYLLIIKTTPRILRELLAVGDTRSNDKVNPSELAAVGPC